VRHNALGLVVNLVLSRFGGAQLQRSALLGAFAAGTGLPFSVDAAAACWDMSPEEAHTTLDMLVEAALVMRLPGGMYALHKALRDHLRKAAMDKPLEDAAKRIHSYYMGLLEQASVANGVVSQQLGQVMIAFRQASEMDKDTAAIFAEAQLTYYEKRGLWANLVALASTVVDAAARAGDLLREHAYLADLGYAHTVLGELDKARACFDRSLALSRQLGDPVGEAAALNNLGAILEREAKYEDAQAYYERSLSIRESLGVIEDIADTLNNIAGALYWQHRYDEAVGTFQRVLDMYHVLNNRAGQAQTLLNVGAVYEHMSADVEALTAYQQSLAIYTNLNDGVGQSQALNNLGIVYFSRGDYDRALSHFKRSLALKDKLGDRHGQASTLNNIALLYEKTGAPSLALEHYEQSYQILTSLEDPRAELVQTNITTLRSQLKSGS
jgi:tetratricopeptide (TPR) repeat protein